MTSLSHKDSQVSVYLEKLAYNLKEKTLLLEYIIAFQKGRFLEVGTGGDSLWFMLEKLSDKSEVQIVGCDISAKVLDELKLRRPDIKKYQKKDIPLQLDLKEANLLNLPFPDNHFQGINVSAVFHEVFSYCGGSSSVKKALGEIYRTLSTGGVFIYRDPEVFRKPSSVVSLLSKDKGLSLFLNAFLPYYYLYLEKSKTLHEVSVCLISCTLNSGEYIELKSVEDFVKIPTSNIDFTLPIQILTNQVMASELCRHYITYLVDCNPMRFVELTKNPLTQVYSITCHTPKSQDLFDSFVQSEGIDVSGGITEEERVKIEE